MIIISRRTQWLLACPLFIAVIQFFWVLGSYRIIESWDLKVAIVCYVLPVAVIGSVFVERKINGPYLPAVQPVKSKQKKKQISKSFESLKIRLAVIILSVLTICFLSYGTIIQSNEWLGTDCYEEFDQVLPNVEKTHHGRSNLFRRIGGGFDTYNFSLEYKGGERILTSDVPYYSGDRFQMFLNTGGAWGLLYKK